MVILVSNMTHNNPRPILVSSSCQNVLVKPAARAIELHSITSIESTILRLTKGNVAMKPIGSAQVVKISVNAGPANNWYSSPVAE